MSRGGMAFDVMLYPNVGNVKNRPAMLESLEKRKRRSKRRTKEEIDNKMKQASERRQVTITIHVIFLCTSVELVIPLSSKF